MRMGAAVLISVLATFSCPVLAICQKPEHEFYSEFRTVFSQKSQE
jgi:hypothetical protein